MMVAGRAAPAAAGGCGFGVCSREEDADAGGGIMISKRIVCYGVWRWGELRRRPVRYVRFCSSSCGRYFQYQKKFVRVVFVVRLRHVSDTATASYTMKEFINF